MSAIDQVWRTERFARAGRKIEKEFCHLFFLKALF